MCTTGGSNPDLWPEPAVVAERDPVREEVEQERKFLLPIGFPREALQGQWKQQEQRQAYAGSPLYVGAQTPRLRIDPREQSVTSKSGCGEIRNERVVDLESASAARLDGSGIFNMVLPKSRWKCVDETGYKLTVDFLQGYYDGVAIAELEWKCADRPEMPDWLRRMVASGEAVEVTGLWSNVDLAAMAWAMPFSSHGQLWEVLASPRIPVVGVEGAPVSGKDDGLDELQRQYGHYCTVLIEAATIFLSGHGDHLPVDNRFYWNAILQPAVVMTQLMQERVGQMLARRKGSSVILVNRTVLSNAAFLDGGVDSLSLLLGCHDRQLAERYDRIVQMEVAPEQIYEKKVHGNTSRCESYIQALEQQEKLKRLLGQYPNYGWVGNSGDFRDKVDALVEQIRMVVPGFGRDFPS